MRSGLTAAIIVTALFCTASTLAQVIARQQPALAHRLAPWDARATALLAASLSGTDASAADRARADELARSALSHNPTNVLAVSALGINAQFKADVATARRYFRYSEYLSRRDLQTQLWSIEDAVARQDISGALRHYDIALRTSPAVTQLLFPVLGAASADPDIRRELVRTLRTRPAWGPDLINFIASKTASPVATAALFSDLGRAKVPVSDTAQAALISSLLAAGENDQAWNYYAFIRPGALRQMSRDPNFTPQRSNPSPLDWTPIATDGANVAVQSEGRRGVALYDLPATVAGPLLQQVQLLPPGQYRLSGRASNLNEANEAMPYWVVTCSPERQLTQAVFKPNGSGGAMFDAVFTVPADCARQSLTLVARASDAAGGSSGQIDEAKILPVAASEARR